MEGTAVEQNQSIAEVFDREGSRLRSFIGRHVADRADVEDILQDVFYEFVVASRLSVPIEQAGAWLFRVARNRITDLFRKKRPDPLPPGDDGEPMLLEEILPSREAGPDAEYERSVLIARVAAALEELPPEQREVFVAHEVDGIGFRELSERTGVGINTLLSRKRYAVLSLRRQLEDISS